jgi:hypothetical protein
MRDDFDSVVADRFKVLDDVDVPDTWSRVLDRVPVPDTPERGAVATEMVTLIDLEPPVPTDPRRKGPMRVLVAGLLAAAAVVAAIVVVAGRDDAVNPADDPAPSVTVPPPTTPLPLYDAAEGQDAPLEPGTYFVDEVQGTPTPRIFVTVGSGWSTSGSGLGMFIGRHPEGDVGYIGFSRSPHQVFLDGCHLSDGYYPGPVTSLDGLVAALSEQRGWVDVTAPSDISIDGYAGKTFQRTAADAAVLSDCDFTSNRQERLVPALLSWEGEFDWADGPGYEPGASETLLVLDIDGTVVVIHSELFPGPPEWAPAEFANVLDSIRIERD